MARIAGDGADAKMMCDFDLPIMRTAIAVDGVEVVRGGVLQDVFG